MAAREIGLEHMMLMPPKPGTCPECAVEHEKAAPHNKESLYYQMRFRQKNGRFASWADAMAHCPDEVKAVWRELLKQRGVDVDAVPGEAKISIEMRARDDG